MFLPLDIPVALVLAPTFFSLRSRIIEESTNPNHVTLADRVQAGGIGILGNIRMRTECLVALTIDGAPPMQALVCIFSITRKGTADSYCDVMSTIDLHKELSGRNQGNVLS